MTLSARLKKKKGKKRKKVKFGDISIHINPERTEVTVIFNKPMIFSGSHSRKFGGFDFNEFSFMTKDHPSLPYRDKP